MKSTALVLLCGWLTATACAAPPAPAPGDLYGWELPHLTAIDTIAFPRRLVRNRSYGRVVAEIVLRRDGSQRDLDYPYVENGDLTRWADKILRSARFTPARLDGSPLPCRLPVHVLFLPEQGEAPPRYEVWLPGDSAAYRHALMDHFLAVNDGLAPLLLRVGAYDRTAEIANLPGTVTFEVYVHKDGAREEGRLVAAGGDNHARQALAAMLDMQVLPARYRRTNYGCWIRILVGFFDGWTYPTAPIDRYTAPYRGWPAPLIAPVGASGLWTPQFVGVDLPDDQVDLPLLRRAAGIVHGHALYVVRVDTSGRVAEWFRARDVDRDRLSLDNEYSTYGGQSPDVAEADGASAYNLSELARLAATELERLAPHLVFRPGRSPDGELREMWIVVTPALFR